MAKKDFLTAAMVETRLAKDGHNVQVAGQGRARGADHQQERAHAPNAWSASSRTWSPGSRA